MEEYFNFSLFPLIAIDEVFPEGLDFNAEFTWAFAVVHLLHLHEVHAVVVCLQVAVYLQSWFTGLIAHFNIHKNTYESSDTYLRVLYPILNISE